MKRSKKTLRPSFWHITGSNVTDTITSTYGILSLDDYCLPILALCITPSFVISMPIAFLKSVIDFCTRQSVMLDKWDKARTMINEIDENQLLQLVDHILKFPKQSNKSNELHASITSHCIIDKQGLYYKPHNQSEIREAVFTQAKNKKIRAYCDQYKVELSHLDCNNSYFSPTFKEVIDTLNESMDHNEQLFIESSSPFIRFKDKYIQKRIERYKKDNPGVDESLLKRDSFFLTDIKEINRKYHDHRKKEACDGIRNLIIDYLNDRNNYGKKTFLSIIDKLCSEHKEYQVSVNTEFPF